MTLRATDFAGNWDLTRSILDRRAGQSGTFVGTACFLPAGPEDLIYEETGRLRLGQGPEMVAQRRYLWTVAPDAVTVRFDDGRPFHGFVAQGEGAGTDHPCGEDHYRVRYDFRRWPLWSAVWTVSGPRKDYDMVSEYSRP